MSSLKDQEGELCVGGEKEQGKGEALGKWQESAEADSLHLFRTNAQHIFTPLLIDPTPPLFLLENNRLIRSLPFEGTWYIVMGKA